MASDVTIKMVGDWSAQMDVPLNNALVATVEMTGRSGKQACGMAMIYMARSARAMTKQAPKNRKVLTGPKGGKYVEKYGKNGQIKHIYKFSLPYKGFTWEDAKLIKSRGLAKRSWFWGLKGLRDSESDGSKPIPGVATLDEFLSTNYCGLIMTDRLKYLVGGAAPANVEIQAANKASNQIMAQAARKLEKQYSTEVPRLAAQRAQKAQKTLERAWRESRAA